MLLKRTFLSISSLNRWNTKLGTVKDSFHLSSTTYCKKDSGGILLGCSLQASQCFNQLAKWKRKTKNTVSREVK